MKKSNSNTAAVQTSNIENANNDLHKLEIDQLRKTAGVKANSKLTKYQLIARIKENAKNAPIEETPVAETAETTTPTAETKKTEEKPKDVIINIWEANVGDVVRYKSSKKPYVVAEKVTEGEKPYVFLVSQKQQYNSVKKEFEVVLVKKGEGVLPEKFDNEILDDCLKIANEKISEKLKLQTEKAEKEAAKKAKAEQQETETVIAEATEETPVAETETSAE